MIPDDEHIENVDKLREELMAALAAGKRTVTLNLPVLAWLAFLDEIQDRRPRNYSALLHDDHLDRLNASIEWLGAEIRHVIANSPTGVAPRFKR
jgi:hypothetical protein